MVKVFAVALIVTALVGVALVAGGAYVAALSFAALAFNSTMGGKTLRCWVLLITSVLATLFTSVGVGYVVFQGVMALA
jgi:hypothetical protein